jgi:hypothetical protein
VFRPKALSVMRHRHVNPRLSTDLSRRASIDSPKRLYTELRRPPYLTVQANIRAAAHSRRTYSRIRRGRLRSSFRWRY